MYQIKIVIKPIGVSEVTLQTDEKDRESIQTLAFYARVSGEIERFRRNIGTILKKDNDVDQGKKKVRRPDVQV